MLEIGEGIKLLLYTQSPAKPISKEGLFFAPTFGRKRQIFAPFFG